ncbi:IS3 family transposase [Nonomuraea sp. NBC_00507]
MSFIDQHADVFGVEPICRVLTEHGCPISSSTYYAAKNRPLSARALRDAELDEHITRIHADNYGVYGARKIWQQLQREGHPVARCTVERRMRALGLQGVRRGRKVRTTVADPGHERAADRLQRDFTASRPNAAWVADFTHVAAWCGVVYVSVTWSTSTHGRSSAGPPRCPADQPGSGRAGHGPVATPAHRPAR